MDETRTGPAWLRGFSRITTGRNLIDALEENDVSAGLQFVIKEKKRWNFRIKPGLRFSDPVETFIKLRLRRNQPLGVPTLEAAHRAIPRRPSPVRSR